MSLKNQIDLKNPQQNRTYLVITLPLYFYLQGPGALDKTCDCGSSEEKDQYQWTCKANDNNTKPGRWTTNSGDFIYNLTNWDINEWLLQTHNDFIDTRFGGFSFGELWYLAYS